MDYINSYRLFKVFPNNQEIKKQHQDKNTFKKYTFFFFWLHRIYLIILQIEQETKVHIEVQVSF